MTGVETLAKNPQARRYAFNLFINLGSLAVGGATGGLWWIVWGLFAIFRVMLTLVGKATGQTESVVYQLLCLKFMSGDAKDIADSALAIVAVGAGIVGFIMAAAVVAMISECANSLTCVTGGLSSIIL